jgi:ATP-binding cassette subfamily F protein 3
LALPAIQTSRTGEIVFSTNDLRVGLHLSDGTVELLSVPDLKLLRGGRAAVVGANGSGKTTLLQTLLDENQPLEGSIKLGDNVEVGYYRQNLDNLPLGRTVLDAFLEAKNILISDARQYLARFLFRGDDVFKPVDLLSGGEKSRLALARLLILEPNFLVLDEPTTHLDIPSREALEQILLSYTGTMLFVSHDRQLISLIADQIWNIQGGALTTFQGTFEDWDNRDKGIALNTPQFEKINVKKSERSQTKREPPKPWLDALEHQIAILEERINKVEQDLAIASSGQNVAEVTRLGEEYNELQLEITEAWDKWGNA